MFHLAHLSFLGTPVWFWAAFIGLVLLVLVFDLGVFNRKHHEFSYKRSLCFISGYVLLAVLFGGWIWVSRGNGPALNFYTGYLIEYSLSMDNILMMSIILAYFKIPGRYQHHVLFWGILGVVLLRGFMIGAGAALIQQYHWILLILGAFVIYSGAKIILFDEDEEASIENSKIIQFLEHHLRITRIMDGPKFFKKVRSPKSDRSVSYATPLFLALITIELVDVMFALDSIPAVFAITTDSFVVFTSNIFAVLGLRTLYFLLAVMVNQFRYLSPAIAVVLVFIGGKVFYAHFFGETNPLISLGISLGVLATGLVLSVLNPDKEE